MRNRKPGASHMDKNLENRIATALTLTDDEATSNAIGAAIAECEAAIANAEQVAALTRERALDPLTRDAGVERAHMAEASFTVERLRAALPKLQARLEAVQRIEQKAAWVKDYDEIATKVDACAEEMKATYCAFAPKMIAILIRARELDKEVRRVRDAKPPLPTGEPDDGRDLHAVELVARGFSGVTLSLDRDLKLPEFWDHEKLAWPPYEHPFGAHVADAVLAMVTRMPPPGSDAEYALRRQRHAEQTEQLKAYYARQAKGAA
jgi:hypothetical protein